MRQNPKQSGHDTLAKTALVIAMYAGAVLITGSGALFLVYSFARNIRLSILSLTIPGFVLALLMLFFGVRSFISVQKFSLAVLKHPPHLSLRFLKGKPVKGKSA